MTAHLRPTTGGSRPALFVQSSDPAAEAIAGSVWIDTSSAPAMKVRNASNDAWGDVLIASDGSTELRIGISGQVTAVGLNGAGAVIAADDNDGGQASLDSKTGMRCYLGPGDTDVSVSAQAGNGIYVADAVGDALGGVVFDGSLATLCLTEPASQQFNTSELRIWLDATAGAPKLKVIAWDVNGNPFTGEILLT